MEKRDSKIELGSSASPILAILFNTKHLRYLTSKELLKCDYFIQTG